MPIIENIGGVMRTHTTEYANINGVLREQNTVSTNNGGVIRTVFTTKIDVKINGITPLVEGNGFMVIVNSGTGTISLPAGARIILGSGGEYSQGGFVEEYTLTSGVVNAPFTARVGEPGNRLGIATKLDIDGNTYYCGNVERIVQSKWGPIGGNGGDGEWTDFNDMDNNTYATDGTGAGGGGAGSKSGKKSHFARGGNNGGYGNFGGNGGTGREYPPTDGSSGAAGAHNDEGGGGGGYASGGGGDSGYSDEDGDHSLTNGGKPGAGIIVIEW